MPTIFKSIQIDADVTEEHTIGFVDDELFSAIIFSLVKKHINECGDIYFRIYVSS